MCFFTFATTGHKTLPTFNNRWFQHIWSRIPHQIILGAQSTADIIWPLEDNDKHWRAFDKH